MIRFENGAIKVVRGTIVAEAIWALTLTHSLCNDLPLAYLFGYVEVRKRDCHRVYGWMKQRPLVSFLWNESGLPDDENDGEPPLPHGSLYHCGATLDPR